MRVSQPKPVSKIAKLALLSLGKLIKSVRLEKAMSQENLAVRLNVSRFTVMELEKGSPTVSIGTVFEAAVILGIPLLEQGSDLRAAAQSISTMVNLLPKRAKKKPELNNDF